MGTAEFNSMLVSNSEFLRPFAITLTRDSEIAKDLFQETLYRAIANREKYNVGTNIKAWLYTIMRNIFINNYRRNIKKRTVFASSVYEMNWEHLQASNYSTEAKVQMKEILNTVDRLPELFKKPFLLYYEGFRYHEIADILKEPLGTVKSRIHFARRLLKAQVEKF
ncbi:MAG: sigma-70 family RNA polymerase sigma factor [Flavitalea sp.]